MVVLAPLAPQIFLTAVISNHQMNTHTIHDTQWQPKQWHKRNKRAVNLWKNPSRLSLTLDAWRNEVRAGKGEEEEGKENEKMKEDVKKRGWRETKQCRCPPNNNRPRQRNSVQNEQDLDSPGTQSKPRMANKTSAHTNQGCSYVCVTLLISAPHKAILQFSYKHQN